MLHIIFLFRDICHILLISIYLLMRVLEVCAFGIMIEAFAYSILMIWPSLSF